MTRVLDFRRNMKPRNYLPRREQWRLLLLVMLLGAVVAAAIEARRGEHYAWLFGCGGGENLQPPDAEPQDGASAIDTRLPPDPGGGNIPDAFFSPGKPAVEPTESARYFRGVVPDYLDSIRDDRPFRSAERDAWFHLFEILASTEEGVLENASTGRVTFIQLFRQSEAYRGELVTIQGTVVRAHRLDAPKNDRGIESYYQIWIRPADNQHFPMVAYVLHLPDGFPLGMEVAEDMEITGFFFKRWAYLAGDTVRTAPVVLARTGRWYRAPETPRKEEVDFKSVVLMIAGAAIFATLAAWWVHGRSGRL